MNRQDISKIVEDTKETLSFLKLGRLMKDNDLKDLSERYQEEKSNTKKANIKREYLEATADDYIEEIDGNRRQQLMKRFLQIPKVSRQKIMEIISRMRTTPKRKKSQLETRVDKSVELFRSMAFFMISCLLQNRHPRSPSFFVLGFPGGIIGDLEWAVVFLVVDILLVLPLLVTWGSWMIPVWFLKILVVSVEVQLQLCPLSEPCLA